MTTHLEISEIVIGMILADKIQPEHVDPQTFHSPYGEAIKLLLKGADLATLYNKIGLMPIKAASDAHKIMSDQLPGEMIKLLERAAGREELADLLERELNRLRKGYDADVLKLEGAIEKHINLDHRYETADKIEPSGGSWLKTGYKPLDRHMGGLPMAGLTTVAATTGIGKTTFMVQLAKCLAQRKKKSVIYTLEQTRGQLVKRLLEVMKVEGESEDYRKYIRITDDQLDVDQLCAEASRMCAVEDIDMIGVDFIDLLINTEESEPKVAHIYRSLAQLAKKVPTQVIAVAQLHRYEGGTPRIQNVRWSGLCEAMSSMVILLYNPTMTYGIGAKKSDNQLPLTPGKAWCIVGKSRYGYREGSIGAFQVDWDGQVGWGTDTSMWKALVM